LSPEIVAAGQFAGTLDYLAPEQIQGRALDGRTDLYSLACAGFELLCGTPPFGHDHGPTVMYSHLYVPPPAVSARRTDLTAAVDRVLATALAKNPADRYPTCGQFAEDLRTALGLGPGGPVTALMPSGPRVPEDQPLDGSADPRPGPVSGPGRSARRRPRVIGLVVALAVTGIATAVAIGAAWPADSARDRPASSSPAAISAPPSSPAPTSTRSPTPAAAVASSQAAAVDHLLGSSAATRKALQGAVSQARACTNLSGAVSQIQDTVNQRSTEYSRASALPTSALADGTIVKTDLTAALRASLAADRDYLTWARQRLTLGCAAGAQSEAYNAAYDADQQANAAKVAFAQVWNPVAARYGVQQESPSSI
jgi:serine/threonine protein kinase